MLNVSKEHKVHLNKEPIPSNYTHTHQYTHTITCHTVFDVLAKVNSDKLEEGVWHLNIPDAPVLTTRNKSNGKNINNKAKLKGWKKLQLERMLQVTNNLFMSNQPIHQICLC